MPDIPAGYTARNPGSGGGAPARVNPRVAASGGLGDLAGTFAGIVEEAQERRQRLDDFSARTEAGLEFNTFATDALEKRRTAPEAPSPRFADELAEELAAERDRRLEALDGISPEGRASIRADLDGQIERTRAAAVAVAAGKSEALAVDNIGALSNRLAAGLARDPAGLEGALGALAAVTGDLAGAIDPDVLRDQGRAARAALVRSAAEGWAEVGDAAKARALLADPRFDPDMTRAERSAAVAAVEASADRANAGARLRVKALAEDHVNSVRATGRPVVDAATVEAVLGAEAGAAFRKADARAHAFHDGRRAVLEAGPRDVAGILARFRPEGEDFTDEAADYADLVKVAEARDKALGLGPGGPGPSADPAGYVAEIFGVDDPELRLAEQERLGVPANGRRVLTRAEAETLVSRFENAGPEAQGDLIRMVRDEYGRNFPAAWRDLARAGLPAAVQLAADWGAAPMAGRLMEAAGQGDKALKERIGEGAVTDVDETVRAELEPWVRTIAAADLSGGGAAFINGVEDSLRLLGYSLAARMDPQAAARAAVGEMTGRYNFTQTYRVPVEYDFGRVQTWARRRQAADELAHLDVVARPSLFGDMPEEIRKQALIETAAEAGYWVTNEDETGLVLMVPDGDFAAAPLFYLDPIEGVTRYEIRFDGAAAPLAPLAAQPGDSRRRIEDTLDRMREATPP